LIDTFKAQPVKADQNSLLQLTGLKPATAGHLLHIALHGISNANLNEQYITLEDGRPLSAEAMIGPYFRKQTPPISFMFLNACQVGTSGSSLGQASGFPGVMLKKGMLGFIAPLWNIDDAPARNFSEQFYKNALGAGRPVGEVLLELRRKVNFQDSITELAYLYYGHPTLTLHKNI
jgi:CHAT domain-containing protein